VRVPDGLDVKKLLQILREERDVAPSGGQQRLERLIFRIGHLGWVNEADIEVVMRELEIALPQAGFTRGRRVSG
jgi:aspartate aminotransferase-like enzyme